jgi:hypothetical protein
MAKVILTKFRVNGGIHYPGRDSSIIYKGKPVSAYVDRKGRIKLKLAKDEVFFGPANLTSRFPNKFTVLSEDVEVEVSDDGVKTSHKDPFASATKAGLKVKSKNFKNKGERFFVYDPEVSDEDALNKKSLAKEDVDGFVAEYVSSKGEDDKDDE